MYFFSLTTSPLLLAILCNNLFQFSSFEACTSLPLINPLMISKTFLRYLLGKQLRDLILPEKICLRHYNFDIYLPEWQIFK